MAVKIKPATGYVDYEEYEGDTLEMSFNWKDSDGSYFDLTQYTARMQIKKKDTDPNALVTLTNGDGITLGDGYANLYVLLTKEQTAALGKGKYVYDIELTDDSGKVNTLVAGIIVLLQSVTQ